MVENKCQDEKSFFTDNVIMVRPTSFYSNCETQEDNVFMVMDHNLSKEETTKRAQNEFHSFVEMLKKEGIKVH